MALIPCPACQRHVYATEMACPFCRYELSGSDKIRLRRAPVPRMSRAALVLLGMSSVACGGDTEQSSDDTTADSGPTGSGPGTNTTGNATNSASVSNTATSATQSVAAVYGAPPMGGFGITATTGSSTGGTGGEQAGGAAGEAGDTGGIGGLGGSAPLPGTSVDGQPIYGAPQTP